MRRRTNGYVIEPGNADPRAYWPGDVAVIGSVAHVRSVDCRDDDCWLPIKMQPLRLRAGARRRLNEMCAGEDADASALTDVAAYVAVLEHRLAELADAARPVADALERAADGARIELEITGDEARRLIATTRAARRDATGGDRTA